MTASEFLCAIVRASIFTSTSALVAMMLLKLLRVYSPRIHRPVWLLVVLQSWLLVPWTWQVESAPTASPVTTIRVERPLALGDTPPALAMMGRDDTREVAMDLARPMLAVWAVGIAAVVTAGAWHYGRFLSQVPRTKAAVDAGWQREWERQLKASRVRRHVDLCATDELGPLLCFVPCRYLVLVPRSLWTALARRERNIILRHELAHLLRGDLWWSLAIRILALPQWFNPLVWLAVRRFDEAGEWACDDWVSRGTPQP